jgi:hypothetical protein
VRPADEGELTGAGPDRVSGQRSRRDPPSPLRRGLPRPGGGETLPPAFSIEKDPPGARPRSVAADAQVKRVARMSNVAEDARREER